MPASLLEKYNIPAPRYTSYPTVPYWQASAMTAIEWLNHVRSAVQRSREVSLYIHLPYCEQLCTYCGCNKHITRNHKVEEPYIQSLLAEWQIYIAAMGYKPVLRELHLGGGTPTFFHPDQLARLIEGILSTVEVPEDTEYGFEAHPFSTTEAHLKVLARYGFNRISIGVQDYSPEILAIINRQQTEAQITQVVEWARKWGYASVNFDLIYGLPLQTPAHIKTTMQKVSALKPERIAFYSYAHVPWVKPSQRAYSEADLPEGAAKLKLYELGCDMLLKQGYADIGLDHFALPSDSLYKAWQDGYLHRNFMGYTPHPTQLCLALGASAIGDTWDAFAQNEKTIAQYQARVSAGELPLTKGHFLTVEDQIIRRHILNLMCRGFTSWQDEALQCDALYDGLERLQAMQADNLVTIEPFQLIVSAQGRPFLRNICLALDTHYWRNQPTGQIFSKVV